MNDPAMLCQIAAAGVAPLRPSASLTSAASWQSRALARAGYLDHTAPDGSTLIQRLQRVRWSGTAAGEDLAVAGAPGDGREALYVTADFGS